MVHSEWSPWHSAELSKPSVGSLPYTGERLNKHSDTWGGVAGGDKVGSGLDLVERWLEQEVEALKFVTWPLSVLGEVCTLVGFWSISASLESSDLTRLASSSLCPSPSPCPTLPCDLDSLEGPNSIPGTFSLDASIRVARGGWCSLGLRVRWDREAWPTDSSSFRLGRLPLLLKLMGGTR